MLWLLLLSLLAPAALGNPCPNSFSCSSASYCPATGRKTCMAPLTGCSYGCCTYNLDNARCGTPPQCKYYQCKPTDSGADYTTGCVLKNSPADTYCDDGNACTTNDKCDGYGGCSGTPKTCGQCKTCSGGSCVPGYEGNSCNDENKCTDNDKCTAGTCSGTQKTCPTCKSCNTANGYCDVNAPNTVYCDDGNACTENDKCDGYGRCVGTPKTCGTCKTCSGGSCVPVADNTYCDDGDKCTENDKCRYGVCSGTEKTCAVCKECNPANGYCENAPGSCNDGKDCTTNDQCYAGVCTGTQTSTVTVRVTLTGCQSGDSVPTAQLIAVSASGTPTGSGNGAIVSLTKSGCTFTATLTAPNPTGTYRVQIANLGAYGPTVLLNDIITFTPYVCTDTVCATFTRGVTRSCNCLTIGFWKTRATCGGCTGNNCGATEAAIVGGTGSDPINIGGFTIADATRECPLVVWLLGKQGPQGGAANTAVWNVAAQLIGAILNTRTGNCPVSGSSVSINAGAVSAFCSGITATDNILDIINCANSILDDIGFNCIDNTGPCTFATTPSAAQIAALNALNTALDSYNNGNGGTCSSPGYITSQTCSGYP